MARLFRYSDPGGIEEPATLVALSSNVRFGDFTLTNSAAVGDVANSTIMLDDQAGALDLQGLRAFDFRETSAPSNNRVVFRGVVQDRAVSRSTERSALNGSARVWNVDLSDYNWHLTKRLLVDQDADRPAESIGDRLRWLLRRAAHVNINDYGHVTYPSRQMDANDYRLQRPIDVLNDCCIEDNYSFWVDFNEAHGRPELFFIDPSSTDYQASIATSNSPADVDHSIVFFPSIEASLVRSPSRIAFGAAVAYANGFEYRRKDSTGAQFGKLDQTAPMENVKTAARAGRLAQKYVNDNDEETDLLEWEIIVPAEKVNHARHGQLMAVKFVHLPGYEDWVGVRILHRTVMQDATLGEDYYRVRFDATRPSPPGSTIDPPEEPHEVSTAGGILHAVFGGFYADGGPEELHTLWWGGSGDVPAPGYVGAPLLDTTLFTYHLDGDGDLDGFEALVDMAGLSAEAHFGWSTTLDTGDTATVDAELRVNGTLLDTWTDVIGPVPGVAGYGYNISLSATDFSMNAGDVLYVHMDVVITPNQRQWLFQRIGTDRLQIGSGTVTVNP